MFNTNLLTLKLLVITVATIGLYGCSSEITGDAESTESTGLFGAAESESMPELIDAALESSNKTLPPTTVNIQSSDLVDGFNIEFTDGSTPLSNFVTVLFYRTDNSIQCPNECPSLVLKLDSNGQWFFPVDSIGSLKAIAFVINPNDVNEVYASNEFDVIIDSGNLLVNGDAETKMLGTLMYGWTQYTAPNYQFWTQYNGNIVYADQYSFLAIGVAYAYQSIELSKLVNINPAIFNDPATQPEIHLELAAWATQSNYFLAEASLSFSSGSPAKESMNIAPTHDPNGDWQVHKLVLEPPYPSGATYATAFIGAINSLTEGVLADEISLRIVPKPIQ